MTKQGKACHHKSWGIHRVLVLSWASLLVWPYHGWAGGLKVVRRDNSYMVPCTLFPTETAIGMLSLMAFLICYDEFKIQLSIIFICIEKWKLCNEIQVSTHFSNQNRVWWFFFFFLTWTEECGFPTWLLSEKKIEIIHLDMSFPLLIPESLAHLPWGGSKPTLLPLLSFPFPADLPFWDLWQCFFGVLGDYQQVHNFPFALASVSVKGA